MNFQEALIYLRKGETLRRKGVGWSLSVINGKLKAKWDNQKEYVPLESLYTKIDLKEEENSECIRDDKKIVVIDLRTRFEITNMMRTNLTKENFKEFLKESVYLNLKQSIENFKNS